MFFEERPGKNRQQPRQIHIFRHRKTLKKKTQVTKYKNFKMFIKKEHLQADIGVSKSFKISGVKGKVRRSPTFGNIV